MKEAAWLNDTSRAAGMSARLIRPEASMPAHTRTHAHTVPVIVVSQDCGLVASLAATLDNDMPMLPVSDICQASSLMVLAHAAVLVLDIDSYGINARPLLSTVRACEFDRVVVLVSSIPGLPEWIEATVTNSPLFGCLEKPLDAIEARGYIHYLLAEKGLRPPRFVATSRRLANALGFIASHYREKITTEGLSRAIGSSRSRLAHLFSTELDTTISGVVSKVRLEVAKYLLTSTDEKLEKIAASSGFCDSSHLSRVLLKSIGCRPTDYRREVSRRYGSADSPDAGFSSTLLNDNKNT